MEWKKILKASLTPVLILFFMFLIGQLIIEYDRSLVSYGSNGYFSIIWFFGFTLLIYISGDTPQ